jgi:trigger factor
LETVDRPSVTGDYVAIDLHASPDGQRLEPVSVGDFLYEVGSDGLLDGLGDNLVGCSAGDITDFMSTLRFDVGGLGAGTPVEVRVLVKEVKEKRLPELDDDWVSDFTEFDTVEELRDQVVEQLEGRRRSTLQYQLRNKVVSDLSGEVDVDIPGAVIEVTAARIFDVLRGRLEAAGMDFDEYLEAARQDRETFFEQLHQQADAQVRRNVLLDSVATRAGIEVEDHELQQAYEEVASGRDETADELSERLAGSMHEMNFVSDILRSKALTTLVEGAVAADRDGKVLDLGSDPSEGFEIVEAETEQGDQ